MADEDDRPHRLRRTLLIVGGAALGAFLLMQLVPYGWTHSNPPVTSAAPWPNAEAEAIARQSCYDCHSNETDWPAYSYVAPMSWLVRNDVETGRAEMNFSEWDPADNEAEDAIEQIEEGSMPLPNYTRIHGDAELTDEEQATLSAALEQMASPDNSGKGGGGSGDDDGD
ncbi:heme-binding domain-containing protein [Aquihabitans daechungensis]|uniref:heme-binding domain-containing protein n=1 Tax=Aquihabitans daechungensis TaxID=1052257 RepID=UPI003BA1B6B2